MSSPVSSTGTPQGALLSKRAFRPPEATVEPAAPLRGTAAYASWHDPTKRQELVAAARKGGERKALDLPVGQSLRPEEARGVLASVLMALLEGALDPNTARAAAYILQVERKIAEGDILERRIAALEDLIHRNGRGV